VKALSCLGFTAKEKVTKDFVAELGLGWATEQSAFDSH
jgi:hypothetical protein